MKTFSTLSFDKKKIEKKLYDHKQGNFNNGFTFGSSSISNMEEKLKKIQPKIIMVGAFPEDRNNIHGGIVTSCQDLMNSKFPDEN